MSKKTRHTKIGSCLKKVGDKAARPRFDAIGVLFLRGGGGWKILAAERSGKQLLSNLAVNCQIFPATLPSQPVRPNEILHKKVCEQIHK